MKKLLFISAISAFVFAGCNILPNSTKVSPSNSTTQPSSPIIEASPSPSSITTMPSESPTTKEKTYTLADIFMHNSSTDCWFAVNGSVYDVTSYIKQGLHPGEEKILLGCGKDATELYSTKAGKGDDHSDKAKAYLSTFKIGVLAQ